MRQWRQTPGGRAYTERQRQNAKTPERRAQQHAWYEKNKARHQELVKAWRVANAERARELSAAGARRRKYGITPEQHASLLERQGNACAACRRADVLLRV